MSAEYPYFQDGETIDGNCTVLVSTAAELLESSDCHDRDEDHLELGPQHKLTGGPLPMKRRMVLGAAIASVLLAVGWMGVRSHFMPAQVNDQQQEYVRLPCDDLATSGTNCTKDNIAMVDDEKSSLKRSYPSRVGRRLEVDMQEPWYKTDPSAGQQRMVISHDEPVELLSLEAMLEEERKLEDLIFLQEIEHELKKTVKSNLRKLNRNHEAEILKLEMQLEQLESQSSLMKTS